MSLVTQFILSVELNNMKGLDTIRWHSTKLNPRPSSKRPAKPLVGNKNKKTKVLNNVESIDRKSTSVGDSNLSSSVFLRDPKLLTKIEATTFIENSSMHSSLIW
jgi:hypothetical protein